MAEPIAAATSMVAAEGHPAGIGCECRKEKRKALKKLKRKQVRRETAIREREAAEHVDPEEQIRMNLREKEEAEIAERERKLYDERERQWLAAAAARKAAEEEEQQRRKSENHHNAHTNEVDEDDEWDYIEEGPAEIIWQGNEIIVKKKRVRIAKGTANIMQSEADDNRPTSNPLPPQSIAFASYMDSSSVSAQEVLERVAQEVPNFGTEQDKAHCPFHLKTGACRFGTRCSRVHFYPDKSCTLLIKNMYNGPGLMWEQDEGLEKFIQGIHRWTVQVTPLVDVGKFDWLTYTDEEVERCYEEFYEDVHTEFLKFGELVNFKVCNNGSYHLRGNVYVHYKSLDSAVLAYNNINGRYFAGKQITCEFVSVTRWKVAICGEYMKSRLRNCSHGSACNFIHCFRNPGGDYEWADWDNSPPKDWIRRMVALFGSSNEYEYDKFIDDRESDRRWSSDRKRTTNKGRYHSPRSGSSSSPVRDSDRMADPYSRHSVRRDRSSRSTVSVEKRERSEELKKSDMRHKMRSYDSREDAYNDNDKASLKRHQKYEEKCYVDQERYKKQKENMLPQKRRKTYVNEHMKSRRYKSRYYEQVDYAESSCCVDDNREVSVGHSNSPSSDESNRRFSLDEGYSARRCKQSSHRLSIDEERYNGKFSEELGSRKASSTTINSQHSGCPTEKREQEQYDTFNSCEYDMNGQFQKENDHKGRLSCDSDWIYRNEASDPENARDHSSHRCSNQKKKHDKSSRKRKHRQGTTTVSHELCTGG